MALPLLVVPYLARVLGPAGWGRVTVADAAARMAILVVGFGFELSATRAIATAPDGAMGRIASDTAACQALLAMAVLPVALAAGGLWIPAFVWAVAEAVRPVWYFQGQERVGLRALLEMPPKAMAAAAVFALVRPGSDGMEYFAAQAAGAAASAAAGWTIVARETRLRWPAPATVREAFQDSITVFAFRGAVSLYTTANVLLLGWLAGPQAAALFAGAEKIARAAISLLYPVSQTFYPAISRLARRGHGPTAEVGRRATPVTLGLGAAVGLLLWTGAPLLVRLALGPGYEDAAVLLRWLAPMAPAVALSNLLGLQWLLPFGRDRQFTALALAAGLANIALILLLAPAAGALGTAWAALASETLMAGGCCLLVRGMGRLPWEAAEA